MYDEGKEFVAETEAAAIERAVSHFGVPEDRLDVRVISDALDVAGLGGSIMIVAMSLDAARQPRGRRERPERSGRSGRPDRTRPDRTDRGGRRERPEREERSESAARALGPSVVEVIGELTEAGEFARELLRHLELPGTTQLEEGSEGGEAVVRIRGRAVDEAARRDDRFLDSLAHLIERALEGQNSGEPIVHVAIGSDDPAELALEGEARERGEEVVRTGEAVTLESMNARERWVVHNALKQVDGVRSSSVGDGRERRVKIEPA